MLIIFVTPFKMSLGSNTARYVDLAEVHFFSALWDIITCEAQGNFRTVNLGTKSQIRLQVRILSVSIKKLYIRLCNK